MAANRRGSGGAFFLGCNHPLWPSLGETHGPRSSMDVQRSWSKFTRLGRENLLRNRQNNLLWWNDPDCVSPHGALEAGRVPVPHEPHLRERPHDAERWWPDGAERAVAGGPAAARGERRRRRGARERSARGRTHGAARAPSDRSAELDRSALPTRGHRRGNLDRDRSLDRDRFAAKDTAVVTVETPPRSGRVPRALQKTR